MFPQDPGACVYIFFLLNIQMPGNNNNNLSRAIKRAEYLMKKRKGEMNQKEFNNAMSKLSGGRRTRRASRRSGRKSRRSTRRS